MRQLYLISQFYLEFIHISYFLFSFILKPITATKHRRDFGMHSSR